MIAPSMKSSGISLPEAIRRIGPVPTLIEWDKDVPEWPVLKQEAERAEAVMLIAGSEAVCHAVG